jgi:hypothetical protein
MCEFFVDGRLESYLKVLVISAFILLNIIPGETFRGDDDYVVPRAGYIMEV